MASKLLAATISAACVGLAVSMPAVRPCMPVSAGLVPNNSVDLAKKPQVSLLGARSFEPQEQGQLPVGQARMPTIHRNPSEMILRVKSFGEISTEEYSELCENLWQSAEVGDSAQVLRFVKQGAWPNHIGTFGQLQGGALHLAAMNGHEDMCELLVRLGADVNLKNDHGLSPLHMACQLGQSSVARRLLFFGADPIMKCKMGDTPGDKAWLAGFDDIQKFLEQVITEESASLLRFRQRIRDMMSSHLGQPLAL